MKHEGPGFGWEMRVPLELRPFWLYLVYSNFTDLGNW